MGLPNLITFLRLILVPIMAWAFFQQAFALALLVFVVAAVSDALDGYLARAFHQETALGAVLDPVADKLLVATAVLALAWYGFMPLWLMALILMRDVVIVGGVLALIRWYGFPKMAPTRLSKFNTLLQFLLLLALFAKAAEWWDQPVLETIMIYAVATTVLASGVHYVWIWGRRAKSPGERR